MPRAQRIVISSPGRLPNYVVGLDVPAGDEIDAASIAVSASAAVAAYLTGENAAVNASTETIDGVEYPPGTAIVFDLVCAAGAPEYDADSPQYVLLDYATEAADEQRLRYKKEIEITAYIEIP